MMWMENKRGFFEVKGPEVDRHVVLTVIGVGSAVVAIRFKYESYSKVVHEDLRT